MTTIKLKKAIFEDEIWNKIKEALDEHKKGETIKLTPQTLWDVSKRKTDWPIDDQSVQKSFTTTGDAPLQSYALLKDKNTEKTQSYCEAYWISATLHIARYEKGANTRFAPSS